MATETKLRQLADKGCPVYYFYSSERYLVRQAVAAATRILTAGSDHSGWRCAGDRTAHHGSGHHFFFWDPACGGAAGDRPCGLQ